MQQSQTTTAARRIGNLSRAQGRCLRSGFTLLELLLILVLIGIGSAVTANRLSGMRDNSTIDLAVERLRDAARSAQTMAATDSIAVRLRVEPDEFLIRVEPLDTVTGKVLVNRTPPPISLRTGAEELTIEHRRSDGIAGGDTYADVLFFPDRTCEPASVFVIANAKRYATVRLHASAAMPSTTPSRELDDRLRDQERRP